MSMEQMKSREHAIRPLITDELAKHRFFGCIASPGSGRGRCGNSPLYCCSFTYRLSADATPRTRLLNYCEDHAEKYAKKHGLELGPHHAGLIGPIAEVVFFKKGQALGPTELQGRATESGQIQYTLDVDNFREGLENEAGASILRDGDLLEIWLWTVQAWRRCRFRRPGGHEPYLEIDVDSSVMPTEISAGLITPAIEKSLDPRDLFRECVSGSLI